MDNQNQDLVKKTGKKKIFIFSIILYLFLLIILFFKILIPFNQFFVVILLFILFGWLIRFIIYNKNG
jgi:Na+/melibiose symporter-like transporter